jgi:hypothetical protein
MQFVIQTDTKMYGPFKTANDAVKWACAELSSPRWLIAVIEKPFKAAQVWGKR